MNPDTPEQENMRAAYQRGVVDMAVNLKQSGIVPDKYHPHIDTVLDRTLGARGIEKPKTNGWSR